MIPSNELDVFSFMNSVRYQRKERYRRFCSLLQMCWLIHVHRGCLVLELEPETDVGHKGVCRASAGVCTKSVEVSGVYCSCCFLFVCLVFFFFIITGKYREDNGKGSSTYYVTLIWPIFQTPVTFLSLFSYIIFCSAPPDTPCTHPRAWGNLWMTPNN